MLFMAKKAARAARSMQIEGCASPADINEFLVSTCGFKLHAGFSPATGNGDKVYVINDAGDTIDVTIVDDASSTFLNEKIKELTMATTTAQYQMVVQSDFQRVAIQRAKAPATLGRKDRYRVVYIAASRKEDTKKSILSKINGLRYQTVDEQGAFNEFFDVREIVDKFYAEYEKVRNKLAESITFPAGIPEAERDGYATTLMNRLVFTYFLQTPDPATGRAVIPERFLQTLYGKHASRPGQSYYHCLCHLWFEYFNVEKPRTEADGIFEHVPYLNGGLFARRAGIEDDGTKLLYPDIDVPDGTWEEIFTLLDGYNWTVVESDEDDDELSISPSILGHIYEKQCNQKETGSYYTPDHVTTYIARECISKLSTDRVNEHFKTSYENFLDVAAKPEVTTTELTHVSWFRENVLHDITVCDNACGSGAFLLAAEKILVDLHQQCNKWWEPGGGKHLPTLHAIKKHVVTRNLYGVDLQPGSVEIAKLRLWLSMIPAMQSSGKVEPLPNIDYNILAGNSLVGFVKLPSSWGKSLLSDPERLKRRLAEYRGLKDAFRSATASADREDLKEKIDTIRKSVRAELDALLKEDLAITADQVAALKPFHWGFEFEEVFSRGGFDIIIGNPPYNVNRTSEDLQYKTVDDRINDTYLAMSTAQKTKLYDMYVRFLRWSSDHISKNGIIAFISNNSFIDSKGFDGFRNTVAKEFNEMWIVNLKGNARTSGDRRKREGGNVFYDVIKVGVAVYFLVNKERRDPFTIHYNEIGDYKTSEEKLSYLATSRVLSIPFKLIIPDKNGNWINTSSTDFDSLVPIHGENGIFKYKMPGISTNRDAWVYDISRENLERKMRFFIDEYNRIINSISYPIAFERLVLDNIGTIIKWSDTLKRTLISDIKDRNTPTYIPPVFNVGHITPVYYRPFITKYLYADQHFIDRLTGLHISCYGKNLDIANETITISASGSSKNFDVFCTNRPVDLHFIGDTQCFPMRYMDKKGVRMFNMNDTAITKFKGKYGDKTTEEDIFHYVIAVLNDPAYREKYKNELARQIPRVPLRDDFRAMVDIGKKIADTQINFLTIDPYPLHIETSAPRRENAVMPRADKIKNMVIIDESTRITGFPESAWTFKIGSMSVIEIACEQYKHKAIKDDTVRERFDDRDFSTMKDVFIGLIASIAGASIKNDVITTKLRSCSGSMKSNSQEEGTKRLMDE
jgi:type I restriction-modification system DNA methylase subunit